MVTAPSTRNRRQDVTEPITIKHLTDGDRARVRRLAELDGRPAPVGDTLLADVEGRLRAAVGVDDGSAVADPFWPADDIVMLLQMRAEQERVSRASGGSARKAA
jgi:hypothetical protein